MVLVEFVYEKIHAYLLLDKLYRNYQIYRNSSGTKRAAVCKIFTPGYNGSHKLQKGSRWFKKVQKDPEGPGRFIKVQADSRMFKKYQEGL